MVKVVLGLLKLQKERKRVDNCYRRIIAVGRGVVNIMIGLLALRSSWILALGGITRERIVKYLKHLK